jgi:hypothetical protein
MPGTMAGVDAAAAATAATIKAVRASGVVVQLEPEAFEALVNRMERPLVVTAPGGFFSSKRQYLVPYRGLVFHTRSAGDLSLPGSAEIIEARKLWVPEG